MNYGTLFSRLAFWYGLGFEDLSRMPLAALRTFYAELPARRAELQLTLAAVITLPWMEERERRNVLERWERQAAGGMAPARVSRAALALHGIHVTDVVVKA